MCRRPAPEDIPPCSTCGALPLENCFGDEPGRRLYLPHEGRDPWPYTQAEVDAVRRQHTADAFGGPALTYHTDPGRVVMVLPGWLTHTMAPALLLSAVGGHFAWWGWPLWKQYVVGGAVRSA